MAKRPEDRPADLGEVLRQLEAVRAGLDSHAILTSAASPPPGARRTRKWPLWPIASLVSVAVLVIGGLWVYLDGSSACSDPGDGVLTFALFLDLETETGIDAVLQLAADDINSAGGVNGAPVVLRTYADSRLKGPGALDDAFAQLAPDVDVVVAPIVGQRDNAPAVADLCRVHIDPEMPPFPLSERRDDADTMPYSDRRYDGDRTFRLTPDWRVGVLALVDVVAEEGGRSVAVLASSLVDRPDARLFQEAAEARGLETSMLVAPASYERGWQLADVLAAEPDALVVIGHTIADQYVEGLLSFDVDPQVTPIHVLDGRGWPAPPGELTSAASGVAGVRLGLGHAESWRDSVRQASGRDWPDWQLPPEAHAAYDAVIIAALAADAAGSDTPKVVAGEIAAVTGGGTKCYTFASCRELQASGADIDYDGPSGPIALDANGHPTEAIYEVFPYDDPQQVEHRVVTFETADLDW